MLFNNRAKELEDEIDKLENEGLTLNTRLSVHMKENTRLEGVNQELQHKMKKTIITNLTLETQIEDLNIKVVSLEKTIQRKEQEISDNERLIIEQKSDMEDISSKASMYLRKILSLENKITELKKQTPIHNQRNGGRKSIITDTTILRVVELKNGGKSLSQIATLLTLETGVNYSKSTIKKIVDLHITGDKSCVN